MHFVRHSVLTLTLLNTKLSPRRTATRRSLNFPIDEKMYSPGDVVVVVSGDEINFHGIIGKIEDGYAFASDPKGSLLPAGVQ